MQSEGLEGFPDRAKQLLTLGSTFFLAFLPLGAVVAVFFAALAFGLGDSFVHTGGAPPPPYVDPDTLLTPDNAPGVPFVRFRRNYTDYSEAYGPLEETQEEQSEIISSSSSQEAPQPQQDVAASATQEVTTAE